MILAACGPNNATPAPTPTPSTSSESTSLNSSEDIEIEELLKNNDLSKSENVIDDQESSSTSENGKITKKLSFSQKAILKGFASLLLKIAKDPLFQNVALVVTKVEANQAVTRYLPDELNSLEKNIRNYINDVTVDDVADVTSSIMTTLDNLKETFKNSKIKSSLISVFDKGVDSIKSILEKLLS